MRTQRGVSGAQKRLRRVCVHAKAGTHLVLLQLRHRVLQHHLNDLALAIRVTNRLVTAGGVSVCSRKSVGMQGNRVACEGAYAFSSSLLTSSNSAVSFLFTAAASDLCFSTFWRLAVKSST